MKRRCVTQADLINWEESDCFSDDIFVYFSNTEDRDWVSISNHGRYIWELMLNEKLPRHSVQDTILSAVAAQAHDGAFAAISHALGVDKNILVGNIEEYWDLSPVSEIKNLKPLGFSGLKKCLTNNKTKKFYTFFEIMEDIELSDSEIDHPCCSECLHGFLSIDEEEVICNLKPNQIKKNPDSWCSSYYGTHILKL